MFFFIGHTLPPTYIHVNPGSEQALYSFKASSVAEAVGAVAAEVEGSALGWEASRRRVFRGRSPSFSRRSVNLRSLPHAVLDHMIFPL